MQDACSKRGSWERTVGEFHQFLGTGRPSEDCRGGWGGLIIKKKLCGGEAESRGFCFGKRELTLPQRRSKERGTAGRCQTHRLHGSNGGRWGRCKSLSTWPPVTVVPAFLQGPWRGRLEARACSPGFTGGSLRPGGTSLSLVLIRPVISLPEAFAGYLGTRKCDCE